MKKIFSRTKNTLGRKLRSWKTASRSERGQVLVVVTIAMLALVAFVGLTVDVGLLYLKHGQLRRAVDAAALAASSQFREGYTYANLEKAALEFLELNGFLEEDGTTAHVDTCDSATAAGDTDLIDLLCTTPKRKLVRVEASTTMQTAFLKVIGIHEVPLHAQAVSEAASLDVVLAIDTSESMTWDEHVDWTNPANWQEPTMRDPYQCNLADDCHPFKEVKEAAKAFVDQLYFPYDRVSIVTFDQTARYVLHFSDDPLKNNAAYIKSVIQGLQVFTPDVCVAAGGGPCRDYERYTDDPYDGDGHGDGDGDWSDELIVDESPADSIGDTYQDFQCPYLTGYGAAFPPPTHPNAYPCWTTNIGAGLRFAGNEFAGAKTANPPPNPEITVRTESLWAVILLSDGAANSSYGVGNYCVDHEPPICRDKWADTRHCIDDPGDPIAHRQFLRCLARDGVDNANAYDVMDFARDMTDFVFDEQQALIFTIGLGADVKRPQGLANECNSTHPDYDPVVCARGETGETFLQYAADPDDDETPFGGEYYYAPQGNDLRDIFLDIADKLATRLTQ
ncbi:MAG: pilus assembly protein TadG-related protein [Chloroflexota bacterium]